MSVQLRKGKSTIPARCVCKNYGKITPDFKDQKIETEATKTCNTSFLSLKRPDFKYVIFKIVEVS